MHSSILAWRILWTEETGKLQYMGLQRVEHNFQMFKLHLKKEEEPDQISNIHWIIKKAREFQKNIYFCFTDYTKALVWITTNLKILKDMGIPDHLTCFLDFPGCSDGKASSYNAGDPGSIPGSGKSPKERNGNPLQNSCLENPMDEEPGRLPHTVSQRIGCDWLTSLSLSASWKVCMQVKKQQIEPDMKEETDSKLGKEYIKTVYCHPT